MVVLDVRGLRKSFKTAIGENLLAIRELNFSVQAGKFACIVGPSGCGKTTALRIILGLENQYEGQVEIAGKGRVAAVFQEPRLLPWRTVRQNVELCLPDHLVDDNLAPLFLALGLERMQQFYPSELSLGLSRRVALARAFATKPELLILDEPFVSLDDDNASRLRKLLLDVWRARPTTVLMVTHNLREAAGLADVILVLSERPARVLECVHLTVPRDQRDVEWVTSTVKQLEMVRARP